MGKATPGKILPFRFEASAFVRARTLRVAGLLGGTLAVLALTAGAPAWAGPEWLSQQGLSTAGENALFPEVAIDGQGDAVAVWYRFNGSHYSVQTADRRAGEGWLAAQDFDGVGDSADPKVAVDAQGTAVAVWDAYDDEGQATVQAAIRPSGEGWLAPENISQADGAPHEPKVAIDPDGNAVAVWSDDNGTTIRAATRPAGGNWSDGEQATLFSDLDGSAGFHDVAVGPGGDTVAIWSRNDGSENIIRAATRAPGGPWKHQDVSAPGANAYYPRVAIDAHGTAVAVWQRGPFNSIRIQTATRPRGEQTQWTSEDLSGAAQYVERPEVAVDPSGNAVAVWRSAALVNSPVSTVQAATREAGDDWSSPEPISPAGGNVNSPQVTIDRQGNAVAVWSSEEASEIQAATRPLRGSWSDPEGISNAGEDADAPKVAVDGQGNAAAIWAARAENLNPTSPTEYVVRAAGYDAAGPQLRNLTVPATGTAGSPLGFSVSPVDVWSGVVSTRWDFGDGTNATGTSVSHTYATPGRYRVKVTSTDSLGNTSASDQPADVPGAAPGQEHVVTVTAAGSVDSPGGASGTGDAGPDATGTGSPALDRLLVSESRRARGLRSCLTRARGHTRRERTLAGRGGRAARRARARRHMRRHGARLRRRCIASYGRIPGRVAGLRARARSKSEIVLSFRAPGTDRRGGPAARHYLVKQSTRPIRGRSGFTRAQTLCSGSCRFDVTRVGTKITLTVTSLRPRTTYYYAVAARDNVSRRLGPRSRVVKARTR